MNIDYEQIIRENMQTLTLSAFCSVVEWNETKVYSKIRRKAWVEGREFVYDPDKNVHIIMENYHKWVTANYPEALKLEAMPSTSISRKKAAKSGIKKPTSPQRQLV